MAWRGVACHPVSIYRGCFQLGAAMNTAPASICVCGPVCVDTVSFLWGRPRERNCWSLGRFVCDFLRNRQMPFHRRKAMWLVFEMRKVICSEPTAPSYTRLPHPQPVLPRARAWTPGVRERLGDRTLEALPQPCWGGKTSVCRGRLSKKSPNGTKCKAPAATVWWGRSLREDERSEVGGGDGHARLE